MPKFAHPACSLAVLLVLAGCYAPCPEVSPQPFLLSPVGLLFTSWSASSPTATVQTDLRPLLESLFTRPTIPSIQAQGTSKTHQSSIDQANNKQDIACNMHPFFDLSWDVHAYRQCWLDQLPPTSSRCAAPAREEKAASGSDIKCSEAVLPTGSIIPFAYSLPVH